MNLNELYARHPELKEFSVEEMLEVLEDRVLFDRVADGNELLDEEDKAQVDALRKKLHARLSTAESLENEPEQPVAEAEAQEGLGESFSASLDRIARKLRGRRSRVDSEQCQGEMSASRGSPQHRLFLGFPTQLWAPDGTLVVGILSLVAACLSLFVKEGATVYLVIGFCAVCTLVLLGLRLVSRASARAALERVSDTLVGAHTRLDSRKTTQEPLPKLWLQAKHDGLRVERESLVKRAAAWHFRHEVEKTNLLGLMKQCQLQQERGDWQAYETFARIHRELCQATAEQLCRSAGGVSMSEARRAVSFVLGRLFWQMARETTCFNTSESLRMAVYEGALHESLHPQAKGTQLGTPHILEARDPSLASPPEIRGGLEEIRPTLTSLGRMRSEDFRDWILLTDDHTPAKDIEPVEEE